ncbi:MAG TPA: hypothetical protein VJL37_05070 [Flavobacterium sp.]|nr:hypothetical protein [Flavobacterium sp.]
MNKIEIWKKYELIDLFQDLEQAEKILSKLTGGSSNNFNSVEDFYNVFVEELYELKGENVPDFEQICIWFAPTSTWDDFVGLEGLELANRICERARKWNEDNIKPAVNSGLVNHYFTLAYKILRIFNCLSIFA